MNFLKGQYSFENNEENALSCVIPPESSIVLLAIWLRSNTFLNCFRDAVIYVIINRTLRDLVSLCFEVKADAYNSYANMVVCSLSHWMDSELI